MIAIRLFRAFLHHQAFFEYKVAFPLQTKHKPNIYLDKEYKIFVLFNQLVNLPCHSIVKEYGWLMG